MLAPSRWRMALLAVAVCALPARAVRPPDGVDLAISRALAWLSSTETDPFSGGVASFRQFTIEVECWHRLAALEEAGEARRSFEREAGARISRAAQAEALRGVLRSAGGQDALTEVALLAARARAHGLDPAPFAVVLAENRRQIETEVARVPPSIRILYAALLPAAGVPPPVTVGEELPRGMLARRPAETDMTLADVYYLTHEIFALSDYALGSLNGMDPEQTAYLLRVLPFFATFYAAGNNLDILGELLACMVAAGMADTHAYQEGIRCLLERQNPDGSFGTPDPGALGRPAVPGDYLHATLNGLTPLLLDRRLRNR